MFTLQRKSYDKIFSSISLRFTEIFNKSDEKIDELLENFSHFRLIRDLLFFFFCVRKRMPRCGAPQISLFKSVTLISAKGEHKYHHSKNALKTVV